MSFAWFRRRGRFYTQSCNHGRCEHVSTILHAYIPIHIHAYVRADRQTDRHFDFCATVIIARQLRHHVTMGREQLIRLRIDVKVKLPLLCRTLYKEMLKVSAGIQLAQMFDTISNTSGWAAIPKKSVECTSCENWSDTLPEATAPANVC